MIDCGSQLIKKLGVCCQYLAKTEISTNDLNKVLKIMGELMGGHGAALIRKHYIRKNIYQFNIMAQWNFSKEKMISSNKTIFPTDLPEGSIKTLNNKNPVIIKDSRYYLPGVTSNQLLVPVVFNKKLYFILSFSEFENSIIDKDKIELGRTIGNIFELWVNKIQANKKYDEIIDFIPNPIIMFDDNGRPAIWNKAAENISGWTKEAKREKKEPNNRSPLYPDLEFMDKEVFDVSKTAVLNDVCNQPHGSIHIFENVTRKREMARRLLRSEVMYRTIIDFAGVGIVLFTKNKILYYNKLFEEILGITDKNISLTNFMDWIAIDEIEIRAFFDNLYRELKDPVTFEFRAGKKEGEWRFFRSYARSIRYENQPAFHFIIDDITQQRKLAQKVRDNDLRMQHEDRLAALGVMAAGIAHELNQPLNTIRVSSEDLLFARERGLVINDNELFEGYEIISKQVLRISHIIKNIRNFSREDRDQCEDVDPNEAIENVFSMIGKQFETCGIKIEKYLEEGLPPLKGNFNNLEQIIMNLVVNARQALEEHRPLNRKLWIKTGLRHKQIFIEIGDNAYGVSDELRMKIFDPFYTTKNPGKGTGLGLSISKTIVAEFGGNLKVYNNEKGGATFFLTAPCSGDQNEDFNY